MKVGIRKPSLKKSIKARTTSKWKRQAKKAIIPGYGKRGTGFLTNPKKAAYNKIYNKTTVDILKPLKTTNKKRTSAKKSFTKASKVINSKSKSPSKSSMKLPENPKGQNGSKMTSSAAFAWLWIVFLPYAIYKSFTDSEILLTWESTKALTFRIFLILSGVIAVFIIYSHSKDN